MGGGTFRRWREQQPAHKRHWACIHNAATAARISDIRYSGEAINQTKEQNADIVSFRCAYEHVAHNENECALGETDARRKNGNKLKGFSELFRLQWPGLSRSHMFGQKLLFFPQNSLILRRLSSCLLGKRGSTRVSSNQIRLAHEPQRLFVGSCL